MKENFYYIIIRVVLVLLYLWFFYSIFCLLKAISITGFNELYNRFIIVILSIPMICSTIYCKSTYKKSAIKYSIISRMFFIIFGIFSLYLLYKHHSFIVYSLNYTDLINLNVFKTYDLVFSFLFKEKLMTSMWISLIIFYIIFWLIEIRWFISYIYNEITEDVLIKNIRNLSFFIIGFGISILLLNHTLSNTAYLNMLNSLIDIYWGRDSYRIFYLLSLHELYISISPSYFYI